MAWTEATIGSALARQTFKSGLVVVPNCTWTGHECDLLVVTEKLMLVDVEVKISRADLKADARKDKWWERAAMWGYGEDRPPPVHRDWPPKVWKHYYALPRAIWKPELLEVLGSSASGVILLGGPHHPDLNMASVERRAKPNPEATPLGPHAIAAVARLASLRMWDAFKDVERIRDDAARTRALLSAADDASIAKTDLPRLP